MSEIVKQRNKTRKPIHQNKIKLLERKKEQRLIKKLEKFFEINFEKNWDQNLAHKLDVKLEKQNLKLENFISRFNSREENLNFQAYDYGDPHRLDTSKVSDTLAYCNYAL